MPCPNIVEKAQAIDWTNRGRGVLRHACAKFLDARDVLDEHDEQDDLLDESGECRYLYRDICTYRGRKDHVPVTRRNSVLGGKLS